MAEESTERFELDVEPSSRYVRHDVPAQIQRDRARTANLVTLVLVFGVVLSLPAYLAAAWLKPDALEPTRAIFDKWYSVVSPLVGTAIGAYYGSRFGGGKGA